MMRKSVLLATLALFTLMIASAESWGAYIALDPTVSSEAVLEVTSENSEKITLEWNAGGFNLDENNDGWSVSVNTNLGLSSGEDRPGVGGLIRLPWGRSAQLVITDGELISWSPLSNAGDKISLLDGPTGITWARLDKAVVMRDITAAPLIINPVQNSEDGTLWMLTNLTFEVRIGDPLPNVSAVEPARPVSRAFMPMYESMVLNELDDLGLRLSDSKGTYLLVIDQNYVSSIGAFIEWKRQMGYNIEIYSFETTPSFSQLRQTILNYYDTLDPPLEYILIVGDENRGPEIPCDRIVNPADRNEVDVTDWSYVFIDGDDYFPEVFIGRMTVGTTNEAMNASNRGVTYERDPFRVNNQHRWTHATLVAGNFAEGDITPSTPIATTQWLMERLLGEWGFTDVDTLTWRQGSDNNATPGDIDASINEGTNWVTYRGWGNSTGWLAPAYNRTDVDNLNNAHVLPVVLSCVCNTGDFGNPNNTKCFGEHWITAGNPNNPTGAVAVVAPSDLHTQTKFNNPMLAGFMTGVYQENMRNISQATLRGKWEIFLGQPLERDAGQGVEFYSSVYHIFGDPTLSMWTKRPGRMNVDMVDEIALGQDFIDVAVTTNQGYIIPGAYVQLRQGDDFFAGGFTDDMGEISLTLLDIETGDIEVTVTRPDFVPVIETIDVTESAEYVGVSDWSVSPQAIFPGTEIELTITLTNTGTTAQTGVSATLTHPDADLVTVNNGEATFGDIGAGASASNGTAYTFTMLEAVPDMADLEFELEVTGSAGGPWSAKIWTSVGAAKFEYSSHTTTGSFEPAGEASLTIEFVNVGSVEAEDVTVTLDSWDETCTVSTTDPVSLGTVAPGESASIQTPFEVSINSGTYGGRVINFAVMFESNGEVIDNANFALPLEGVTSTDPLGPDSYGYFAYDQTDTGFDNTDETVPEYQWWDLANNGGELHELSDDANFFVELPFDFSFYGVNYEEGSTVTVSSNGWLDFQEAPNYYRHYFRNWHIPGGLGPKAFIAGFWDDLKPPTGEVTSVYTSYDDENGLFIVEWHSWNRYSLDQHEYPARFAIVLKDPAQHTTPTGDGIIEVHYSNCPNVDSKNNYATVGIENEDHTAGLQYTYGRIYPAAADSIENEFAIRFTTIAPDNYDPDAEKLVEAMPEKFKLYANYPNPFNPTTELRFDLVNPGQVRLSVFNVLGQEVAKLVDRNMQAGKHKLVFDASTHNLTSGMFFVKLEAGSDIAIRKMVFMK
ncbi:MAG: C25 family cysteine peptidase [Candidatus Electryonea clarkiae]|nr:C25 family cysteine peptidase [Candidatus Electryonea clarkiae]MDP8285695.1 C25 family cysteine peptidase [Candidatus Electryonea clarkiae]